MVPHSTDEHTQEAEVTEDLPADLNELELMPGPADSEPSTLSTMCF
jgi:hypothetical protein